MDRFKDKTLLIAGGLEGIAQVLMRHALEHGVKEIRVFDEDETRLVTVREELLTERPDASAMVKFHCVDMCDIDSVDDSMLGIDLAVCIPSVKLVSDSESNPANACRMLLSSVNNVMASSIKHGVQKVVVLSPLHTEPLVDIPSMLAVLMEKVVLAQGNELLKNKNTAIVCARMEEKSDVSGLVDYAFNEAQNGEHVLKQNGTFVIIPCQNPAFERDDLSNL